MALKFCRDQGHGCHGEYAGQWPSVEGTLDLPIRKPGLGGGVVDGRMWPRGGLICFFGCIPKNPQLDPPKGRVDPPKGRG